jgi:ABC-type Fe3+ transport system permease subunit
MDLDGHLIELRTSKVIHMDRGDRVVLMWRGKHDATEYYNVTKRIGVKPPSNRSMYNFLSVGAATCIAGIVGIVVTALLAIRHIHGWKDLVVLLEYLAIGVPSVIVACIGFVLLFVGTMSRGVMTEFQRAVAEETEATSPQ